MLNRQLYLGISEQIDDPIIFSFQDSCQLIYQYKLRMGDFQKVAEQLIAISQKAIQLIKTKNQYAKTLNYQINQLFQQLGEPTQQQGVLLLETSRLHKELNQTQLNILFCKDNRQSSYIIPEDLCTFLHISKHNLKRSSAIDSIDSALIDQFYELLNSEEQLEEDLITTLSETNLEAWFGEVDFFNNGYIDTSALYQYLLHYDSKQYAFEEYNALIVLKIIKRHSLSDKLILDDFKNFLERSREIQIFLTNERLSPAESLKVEPKAVDRHMKNKSNELYSLSSEVSISPQIKIGPKLIDHNYNHFESLSLISRQQIEQQLRQEESITFEQRLIRTHSRNERYIKQAKRQMEGIIPICNVQIQSHLHVHTFKVNSAELIRQIRLLGDIYNRIIRLIQSFLTKNVKFTFVNAFSLLDVEETNSVGFNRCKEFAKEIDINVSIKKLNIFFNCYSVKGQMNYSRYLKIFKYSPLQDEYIRCSARYPFIYQNWSDQLLQNYKLFLAKLIRLIQERQTIVENIQRQKKQFGILLKSFSYIDEIIEILGEEYRSFVRENFSQGDNQLICNFIQLETNITN